MAGISSTRAIGSAQQRSGARRAGEAVVRAPRLLMSWEDWLTFAAVVLVFITVAASIQSAGWVPRLPPMAPTAIAGLLVGLFAARIRAHAGVIHPVALSIGLLIVFFAAQSYADGATVADRLADVRVRMVEWWNIVWAGDISNDNMPFVILVHAITFLAAYLGTWSVYRWHNPWLAVIPGGIVLLANISALRGQPSVAFAVYLFGAMLLVARLHLQKRQSEWRKSGVEYPDFMSLSAAQLSVGIVAVLMIAAWMVPLGTQARAVESTFDKLSGPVGDRGDTFVRLFHNLQAGRGGNFHSFGDSLPVRGDVELGTKTLFDVQMAEAGLLRATSYDIYTGVGWLASDRDSERVDGGELILGDDGAYRDRRVTTATITVRDEESTLLFPGIPLGTNRDSIYKIPVDTPGGPAQILSRRGLNEGDTYNAVASESIASADALRAAGTDYPGWAELFTQLPVSLPESIAQLTAQIVAEAGADNPYDQAVAIETFLRNLPYDLTVPAAPPGEDTVEYFLFTLQRGYFDYHATAMAVMLRTLGVPAQIAVGYAVDVEDLNADGTYRVQKNDAYSWVEVFFPQYGWVAFNPTPDRPAGSGSEGVGTGLGPDDSLGVDQPSLEEIFNEIGFEGLPGGQVGETLSETPVDAPGPFPWWIVWTALGVLVGGAALAGSGRLAYTWGTGSLPQHTKHWARVQRVGRWAGLRADPDETAREWSRRAGDAVQKEDAARTLAMAYEQERYGRKDLDGTDNEEAIGAFREFRNRLFRRVVRRREQVDNGEDEHFS